MNDQIQAEFPALLNFNSLNLGAIERALLIAYNSGVRNDTGISAVDFTLIAEGIIQWRRLTGRVYSHESREFTGDFHDPIALLKLAVDAVRDGDRMRRTAIVDDDFPDMAARFDLATDRVLRMVGKETAGGAP